MSVDACGLWLTFAPSVVKSGPGSSRSSTLPLCGEVCFCGAGSLQATPASCRCGTQWVAKGASTAGGNGGPTLDRLWSRGCGEPASDLLGLGRGLEIGEEAPKPPLQLWLEEGRHHA